MDKVSIIIPTYNRLHYLLNTIKSVKAQTYQNIEIIVVNDCSTEEEYYTYDFNSLEPIQVIHLKENSRKVVGFPCAAYVRNQGINAATGKYIAFCDDDDIWFPTKLELQVEAMKQTGCKMSCTDGLIGRGVYNPSIIYKKYNAEHYNSILHKIYTSKGSSALDKGFPRIWDLDFLKIHNCAITSSVVIEKDILDSIQGMKHMNSGEDYDCWLRALEITQCVYLTDICFYYDLAHGAGQNY
jgi:glycosyltransferase involved in cell wall biosynthesis